MRGLAVAGVLLFHTDGRWLSGGYIGVDVFFVLSGLLMVTVLLDPDVDRLRTSFRAFWLRRARRLGPTLVVVVLAVVLVEAYRPGRSSELSVEVLAALFYVTNWLAIARDTSYFQEWLEPSPLLQTWSLGIEEQFYLGLPLILWVLLRLRARRLVLSGLLGALGAISAAWAWHERSDPMRAYFGTDTRIQALLLGAALGGLVTRVGMVRPGPARPAVQIAGWLAAAGLLATMVWARPWYSELSVMTLTVAAVLAAVLIWALLDSSSSLLARLFSARVLVWVGGISYALYLWHWPVFLWIQGRVDAGLGAQMWAIAVSVILAWCTTRWIEGPMRWGAFSRMPAWRQWFIYASAMAVVIVAALGTGRSPRGAPPPDSQWPSAEALPAKIALFGDSTAYTVQAAFPRDRYPSVGFRAETPLGCGLRSRVLQRTDLDAAKPECDGWQDRWADVVQEEAPRATILMESVWEMYDVVRSGVSAPPGSSEYQQTVTSAIREAIEVIRPPQGGPVYLVGVPCHGATHEFYAPTLNDPVRQQHLNAILQEVARGTPDVHFIDLTPLTCRDGDPVTEVNGTALRTDGVHWTDAGAEYFWWFILRAVTDS